MCEAVVATAEDLEKLWQLYVDVCAQQEHDMSTPGWTLGVYPTKDDIADYLAAGELYQIVLDGQPVAAMALVGHEDPEYVEVPWRTPAQPDEVAVIHLLCVHPRGRGRHLGRKLTEEAIRLARQAGKRVIHLDVYPGNDVAAQMYRQAGFDYVCNHKIFYEDTGTINFEMYECVL